MVMRIGGLASGMDIDSIVEKLMQAERAPLNKLQQQKTKFEWQRDAYRDVNTKLKTFDTYVADNLVLKSLSSKTAASSNSNFVSATPTSSATGTLTIEGVSKLATAARAVSNTQINAIGNTKLSTLGMTGNSFSIIAIQANGEMAKEATEITFDENTTVSQLVSKINSSNAGVSAVFENGRLSVTAKNTGENKKGAAEIQITSGVEDFKKLGFSTLNAAGEIATNGSNAQFTVNGIATERSTNTFSMNGYNVTLKSTFNEGEAGASFLTAATQAEQFAKDNLSNAITDTKNKYGIDLTSADTLTKQVDAIKSGLENKITDFTSNVTSKTTDLNSAKSNLLSTQNFDLLSDNAKGFLNSLSEAQRNSLLSQDITVSVASDLNLNPTQTTAFETLTDEEKQKLDALVAGDLKTANSVYSTLSKEAKEALATDLSDMSSLSSEVQAELTALGSNLAAVKDVHTKTLVLTAANSELTTAKSELVNVNNLFSTYQTAVYTKNQAQNAPATQNAAPIVSLTSTSNIDDMVKKITDFVNTYNGLVKDLTEQTRQPVYRAYPALTSEQKEDMSENEIKLWEEKAKSGLLRNDAIIRKGLSDMRALVYETNHAVTDKRYNTLYGIGITTSKSYNDGGTLEIDEKKLREALEQNPDAVEQLLKNTSGKANDTITVEEHGQVVTKKADTRGFLTKLRATIDTFEIDIEKKAGRATMTDHQFSIGKTVLGIDNRIERLEDKLKSVEERYWKQFSAMESAINKANQQSSIFMQG